MINKNADLIYNFICENPNPIFFLTSDFVIVDLNQAAKNIYKIKNNNPIEDSFTKICPNFLNIVANNNDKSEFEWEENEWIWYCLHSKPSSNVVEYVLIGVNKDKATSLKTINTQKDPIHQEIKNLTQTLTGKQPKPNKDTIEYVKDIYHYMENIIAEIPVSVYWMNRDYIYLGCSNSMARLLNLKTRQDIIGKTYSDLYDEKSSAYYRKADTNVMDTGVSLSLEEPLYSEDGTKKIYLSKKVPLFDSNQQIIGMLGISLDITDRKKAEEDLKTAKEAAEIASTAKTEFIANMSHDIRTPLSGVVGLGEIVEREIVDPNAKAKVHDMIKSADELLNMLNEILDVVSLGNISVEDIHEEPFDLRHLIQTIIDLEKSSIDLKKIELLKNVDKKIPEILIGDHKKIHHILLNLVGNAIKFTKTGNVSIIVKLIAIAEDKASILFEICDTGMGIPSESLDKVFELFYKVTPSYKGLDKGHGVGLHIVKTYTELLGGKIAVESKLNEGSKFSFSLSLRIANKNTKPKNIDHKTLFERSEEPPLIESTREITSSIFPNALEILIIEDNSVARKIAEAVVTQAKCNPTLAIDGEMGLELAQNKHFDLILSDVGLPGISGTEFAKKLRQFEKEQNKPPVPIVAITGHAEGKMREECLSAGMNEVYIKPIRPEILPEIFAKFSLLSTKNPYSHGPQSNSSSTKLSTHGALGIDLPNTEEELFTIDNLLIFDPESAKKIIGDNKKLLEDMLKLTLDVIEEELPLLKTAYEEKNWEQVAKISHKLKGGFLNIGLTRAAIACQYLERYHKAGHRNLLEQLYFMVLKVLDETTKNIPTLIK